MTPEKESSTRLVKVRAVIETELCIPQGNNLHGRAEKYWDGCYLGEGSVNAEGKYIDGTLTVMGDRDAPEPYFLSNENRARRSDGRDWTKGSDSTEGEFCNNETETNTTEGEV